MKAIQELETMTDDELRERLASLEGWTRFDCVTKLRYGKHRDYVDIERVPNYPEDLNACHKLEKRLALDQSTAYVNHLWPQGYAPFQAVHATARQRTIALIFTLQNP